MNSKSDVLDFLEEKQGEHGLLPDDIQQEAYKLLESNENIDREVVSYALDRASEYWRKHIEDKGRIVTGQQSMGIDVEDNFDNKYLRDLMKDIHREWDGQLETEDVSELTRTLTTLPDEEYDPFENTPWDYDPKFTPENHDYPTMFQ